jgi:hypothetical protein
MASIKVATSTKKRIRWDTEAERKLIEIWAEILEKYDGKMMTRKNKEEMATKKLNVYVNTELSRAVDYTTTEVHNKIDSLTKKGRQFYKQYQKKGETGKEVTDGDVEVDIEAAIVAWPNFKTFLDKFKNHPALGPGVVDDAATTPLNNSLQTLTEEPSNLDECDDDDIDRFSCPSHASTHTLDSNSDDSEKEEGVAAKKKKKLTEARVKSSSKKATAQLQFLSALDKIQKESQLKQMEHDQQQQERMQEFNERTEQRCVQFESEVAQKMQEQAHAFQQKMQEQAQSFQQNLMQQNQLFQAQLFKKLFDKDNN